MSYIGFEAVDVTQLASMLNDYVSAGNTLGTISLGQDKFISALSSPLSASALVYKGACTFENLPSDKKTGDMYDITNEFTLDSKKYPAGTNVAWNGTKWDALGGSVDLSVLATKTYADTQDTTTLNAAKAYTDAQITSALEASY